MSGLQSDAASSRRYDVAPRCSPSGKITRHGNPLGAASTRPSIATARSFVHGPARFERLAEVQSTSRALVLRDGDDVVLLSRSGKDLGRYFPEVKDSVRDELVPRCVLDGEIVVPRVIAVRARLDWESLSQRIHPAESRVRKLSQESPPHFIGFDALAVGDTSLLKEPFRARREALMDAVHEKRWCHVTRTTEDPELGVQWLEEFEGARLDGVIAKRLDGPYLPGKREMVKVKHARDADCVAIGYASTRAERASARSCLASIATTASSR